jgi:hypothetical protein
MHHLASRFRVKLSHNGSFFARGGQAPFDMNRSRTGVWRGSTFELLGKKDIIFPWGDCWDLVGYLRLRIEEITRTRYRILDGNHGRRSSGGSPWADCGQGLLAPHPALRVAVEMHSLPMNYTVPVSQALCGLDRCF